MTNSQNQFTLPMGQVDLQIPPQLIDKQDNETIAQIKVWLPFPPINLDFRLNSPEQLLSDEQIQYFLNLNSEKPNATIFIHGYNIPFGHYGKVILSQALNNTDALDSTVQQVKFNPQSLPPLNQFNNHVMLTYGAQAATIYRSPDQVKSTFNYYSQELSLDDNVLNGTGAHNWWLHMEHNLNKAAGFKGFNYYYDTNNQHYTRIINIAWSGALNNELDYIEIEPIAAKTAPRLVSLIKQLHKHQIHINIIAHSAGNIVLLKAMNLLGQHIHYHRCIDNVFLWEAAIPNDALSPFAEFHDTSMTQFWHTQYAYNSANKIYVLYSHNDNVLGPIPLTFTRHTASRLYEKYKSANGLKYTLIALAVGYVDKITEQAGVPNSINSAYSLAHLIGVPLTTLLNDQSFREKIYLEFYAKYHSKLKPNIAKNTLQEQVLYLQKIDSRAFYDVSLLLGTYSAIMNDIMWSYLGNANIAKKLIPEIDAEMAKLIDQSQISPLKLNIFAKISSLAINSSGFEYLEKMVQIFYKQHDASLAKKKCSLTQFIEHKVSEWLEHATNPTDFMMHQLDHDLLTALLATNDQHYFESISKVNKTIIAGQEVAALIITIFNTPGIQPRPALGYSGPDMRDHGIKRLIQQGRIIPIDQSDYLFQHGAMRDPSPELFQRVYVDTILKALGFDFGNFNL